MAINREVGVSALADRAAMYPVPSPHGLALVTPATTADRRIRYLDLVLAMIGLVLLLPALILIALAIKCTSVGPIIFAHDRVGQGGRMFSCLKFRSMACNADDVLTAFLASNPVSGAEWAQMHKLREDPRVTWVGAFLRKTSLDELPQMINVLRGEMSLVGPRPIVPSEIYRYGRYIRHYCSVRPGITGMWQINGRNDASYKRRVALDVLYVRSRSFSLNLFIIGKTVPCVIWAEGTY